MKKWEIALNRSRFQYPKRLKIERGCTVEHFDLGLKIIESFDNLQDCEFAFNKYDTYIQVEGSGRFAVYNVAEYCLLVNEYDEDGYILCCKRIKKLSPICIRLIDADTGMVLRVFNTLKKAEAAKKKYEKQNADKRYELMFN